MPTPALNNNTQFAYILIEKLSEWPAWKVEKGTGEGYDIVISDIHSGKRIYIEFKAGGGYGELPIGSIIPLSRQLNKIEKRDKLFLVTFSRISNFLAAKLEHLGVTFFSKPSVDDVVNNVQVAFSA